MALFSIFNHLDRLRKLEERLETVEREVKNAVLDWDELYEKMRRLTGRVEKRAALIERPEAAATPGTEAERVISILRHRYNAVLPR